MELDFKTVKALSSPTRIKILSRVLEKEYTPTDLSNDIGKSKSTISSHLETLVGSGLVEKDSEEGRKRVVYHPTDKARAIVNEKEKKVKFSIVSSTVTGLVGLGFVGSTLIERPQKGSLQNYAADQGASIMMEGARNAPKATEAASSNPEQVFFFLGLGFLTISISAILYGLLMRALE
ncbi:ArsR/SmtB family transcription factor [Candidatus Nanohalovita haloferacivicina]|uniref:ArsR/SmtB family transcription factor n=1 Tax=Candidatus Nanohalovita haloferacivicina TaxID=2978046 RepID=UPI00325FA3CB|nr:Transcriptional regulator containing HTH domain, ArsR family [Candidatus Nanohalobia archaeon BNXNv]